MEGLDDLEFLSEYREDNRIEAKRAQGGLLSKVSLLSFTKNKVA